MDKTIATIQMAIRAQKIVFGEQLLLQIKKRKVYVVLIAKDAGPSTTKKIGDKCHTYKIPLYQYFSKIEFCSILQKDIVACGINDKNLTKKLIENMKEGSVFYEEKNETEQ